MRIYILEKECKNRDTMMRWLSEENIEEFEAFENYTEFMNQILRVPPDICFIRIGTDGIPGFKTSYLVKKYNSDIRIIFVSDNKEAAVDAYKIGVHGYLLCPVDRTKFMKYLTV